MRLAFQSFPSDGLIVLRLGGFSGRGEAEFGGFRPVV